MEFLNHIPSSFLTNILMGRYKETFQTWNKLAQLYQDKFMDLGLYNLTYDFICQSIIKENAT